MTNVSQLDFSANEALTRPAYTVYTYRKQDDDFDDMMVAEQFRCWSRGWDRAATCDDRKQAVQQARELFSSGLYEKVEVQKMYVCGMSGSQRCDTINVFSDQSGMKAGLKSALPIMLMGLTTLVCLVSLVAYL
jgi:hypothetical protein